MAEPTTYQEVIRILEAQGEEVNGYDFYRDIFPDTANSYEMHDDFSHPHALFLYYDDMYGYRVQAPMYRNTWECDYMRYVEQMECCLCGGLMYRGNKNRLENAQRMNTLIFDLDGVGDNELRNLFHRFTLSAGELRSLPTPTYLVASGTGVHLYYVFDEPIDLFPNIKLQLKSLKHDLTFKIWEYKATSTEKSIQYQSINQAFRMPGSINEKHGVEIRAFRIGERVNINYLNRYVINSNNQVDLQKRFRPSKMTREEAMISYPGWYQKVVVEGKTGPTKWNIGYRKKKKVKDYALYEWWLKQIDQIKGGHRYFFLMCMAIYACKNDVPKSKLEADMEEVYKKLQNIEHTNPMKREDIKSALDAYSREYYNFVIDDIEKLTEVRIQRNKRNGRSQEKHMEIMRAIQNVVNPNWREGAGRPQGSGTAKEKVELYRREHPEASVTEVARALGISRPTVYKWWDVDFSVHMRDENGHIMVKVQPSQLLSDMIIEDLKKEKKNEN